MDPITLGIGAGLTAAGSIASTVSRMRTAKKQEAEAKRLAQTPRPTYRTPTAVTGAVDIARDVATRGIPGLSTIQDEVRATTAGGTRAIQEAGGTAAGRLAALGGMVGGQQRQMRELGVQDQQQRLSNIQNLMTNMYRLGQYQDREFEMNEFMPYQDAMRASEALTGASMQNRQAGIDMTGKSLSGIGGMVNSVGNPGAVGDDSMIQQRLEALGVDEGVIASYMNEKGINNKSRAMRQILREMLAEQSGEIVQ